MNYGNWRGNTPPVGGQEDTPPITYGDPGNTPPINFGTRGNTGNNLTSGRMGKRKEVASDAEESSWTNIREDETALKKRKKMCKMGAKAHANASGSKRLTRSHK